MSLRYVKYCEKFFQYHSKSNFHGKYWYMYETNFKICISDASFFSTKAVYRHIFFHEIFFAGATSRAYIFAPKQKRVNR